MVHVCEAHTQRIVEHFPHLGGMERFSLLVY